MRGYSKLFAIMVLTALMSGFLVVLSAHAADVRIENNKLIKENEVLQTEIDTLDIQLKSANSVENIERVATEELGMVYPQDDECVYLSTAKDPKENLAMTIRENAYN